MGAVVDNKDIETLLTVGEAAEIAGVALIDLRDRIRSGRLRTIRAQRMGDELALLSLANLIEVYPVAGTRPHQPELTLLERGIELVQDMPMPQPLPKPVPEPAPEAHEETPAPLQGEPRELPQVAFEVELLEQRIEELKSQVQQARKRNQSLLLSLETASADAQRVLDDEAQPALRRSRLRDRVEREQKSLDKELSQLGGGSSVLGWLVGSAAVIGGLLLMTWARSPVYAAAVAPAIPEVDQAGVRQQAVLASLLEIAAEADRIAQKQASLAVLRALDAEPEAQPEAELAPLVASVPATVPSSVPETILAIDSESEQEPERKVVPLAPSASPTINPSEHPAQASETARGASCEVYPLTRAGQPLREVLGPCLGKWNPGEEYVVGSHRRGGKTWCRHHFVIASELGGSVVRAKSIAEFADREGLIAPLMQRRLDHAASAFLSERAGVWIESGFEAGTPVDHVATRLVGNDRWSLESWARLVDEQGVVERRRFRMQLELGGAAFLDHELKFEWLD